MSYILFYEMYTVTFEDPYNGPLLRAYMKFLIKIYSGRGVILECGILKRHEFKLLPDSSIVILDLTDESINSYKLGLCQKFEINQTYSSFGPKWVQDRHSWPAYAIDEPVKRVLNLFTHVQDALRLNMAQTSNNKIDRFLSKVNINMISIFRKLFF